MRNSIAQPQTETQAPTAADYPETYAQDLATAERFDRFQDLADAMHEKNPEIGGKMLEKAVELAAVVLIHNDPLQFEIDQSGRRELNGYRLATVNGYAIRKSPRGNVYWNSPKEWHVHTCTCKSWEHKSGTATITTPAAFEVNSNHPKTHEHTICKHIAAYGIRYRYETEEAKAREAAAADFFKNAKAADFMTLTKREENGRTAYTLNNAPVLYSQLESVGIDVEGITAEGLSLARADYGMETQARTGASRIAGRTMGQPFVTRLWKS